MEACGRKWSRVAERVAGRTAVQVRERYVHVLDPLINRAPLSEQEGARLKVRPSCPPRPVTPCSRRHAHCPDTVSLLLLDPALHSCLTAKPP